MHPRAALAALAVWAAFIARSGAARPDGGGAVNVLHIISDDLRPELPPYGHTDVYAPNVQRLADEGVTFNRAYVQIAVCSPSRVSFLSGRRPRTVGTYNFVNTFRQAECGAVEDALSYVGVAGLAPLRNLSLSHATGGAAQCCTSCTDEPACARWTYARESADPHTAGIGWCVLFSLDDAGAPPAAAAKDLAPKDLAPVAAAGALSGAPGDVDMMTSLTTLPQHFKNSGYLTLGVGKVFHTEEGGLGPAPWVGTGLPPSQDPPSWTAPDACGAIGGAYDPPRRGVDGKEGLVDDGDAVTATASGAAHSSYSHDAPLDPMVCNQGLATRCAMATSDSRCWTQTNCSCIPPMIDQGMCANAKATVGVVLESGCAIDAALDGSDDASGYGFVDRKIADDAAEKLPRAAAHYNATGQPFYAAVGLRKTHLSWRFPAPWLARYDGDGNDDDGSAAVAGDLTTTTTTRHPTLDPSAPEVAYYDSRGCESGLSPWDPMDNATAVTYRMYYKASV